MNTKISIAIDGPAAAGKSTVAKQIAEQLTYIYIDTGAMYRSLTYKALQQEIDVQNEESLSTILEKTTIELKPSNEGQLVFLDGTNVTDEIRSNVVTNNVSHVAAHRLVREEMVQRQKDMAQNGGVVMDGRDIGTQVLPHAEVKIFLLASVEERAKRRFDENIKKGIESNLQQLMIEIAQRDKLDSEREVSPLIKAHDAIEIDTTSLSISQVVDKIMTIVHERI
ncbi:cytidylate kinase [Bacillus mesophilus]|uniref:Cytidylate kinase n=1 Tax=Bacillus mesophilus TaxID=1808955 RepID=A0A6M0Q692_9BACI|nr:(d)CMP kinase [Bacillus mesophilus]MBM7661226.1 cytidylate kinase [Bacillus mesophilus]NEY71249.1 (d)CMP kinase [Bacillus mesophilus]